MYICVYDTQKMSVLVDSDFLLFSVFSLICVDPEGLMQALEELDYLAALDNHGNLSEIGIIISELPLDPQMAKALLASCEFDCVSEMLTIAAMLSGVCVWGGAYIVHNFNEFHFD